MEPVTAADGFNYDCKALDLCAHRLLLLTPTPLA